MLADAGVAVDRAQSSPIGNGQIAELANDWDGYAGEIPKTSALGAEVLKQYGYATGAWGKWHNTPAIETTAAGPFHNWPSEIGFEYFYGFLAGEASQYEPNLVRNTTSVLPPRTPEEGYHLSEDLADDAIAWLHRHQAFEPDKPFFMYWATGCLHAPHHVTKEWADKYAGKFDDGWDAYRERVFARAKEKGWIPADAQLTPRDPQMPAWEDIPEDQRPFQRRLMEVAAGYAEHADVQAGRVVDEIEHLGLAENTLIFYIWGDNGSSGEGQNGTISELLAQNGIPTTVEMHIKTLEDMGGLDLLGTPRVDNQYHSGWASAGSTPYSGDEVAPVRPRRDAQSARRSLAGEDHARRDPADPVSSLQRRGPDDLRRHRHHPAAGRPRRHAGPDRRCQLRLRVRRCRRPGAADHPVLRDHGQPRDLPRRLDGLGDRPTTAVGPRPARGHPRMDARPRPMAALQPRRGLVASPRSRRADAREARADEELFTIEAARNSVFPIGGGLWIPVFHPELRISTPYREWNFGGDVIRMPEFCAPALGNRANLVTIDADVPDHASGVLYALGSSSGGLTAYLDDGYLCYEYNLFIVMRTKVRSEQRVPAGPATITISTEYAELKPGGPLNIELSVNGDALASGTVPVSAPLLFTANDCLDIGVCHGGRVSLDYSDRAPFRFNGTISNVNVRYTS